MLGITGIGGRAGFTDMEIRNMPVFNKLPKSAGRFEALELPQTFYGQNIRAIQGPVPNRLYESPLR